ncbi:MAG: hypothetical protein IH606_20240 [Burkholderiales bacterium]|nr:hypothetical protein [Burkholderiales bacterium]
MLRTLVFAIGAGMALACQADVFVRDDIIVDPDPAQFNICHGNGCDGLVWVKLGAEQWQRVREVFATPADTPAGEREQIRTAVALLETTVGAMTGTASDRGGNLAGFGLPGQMDCIDESTNTTTYLRMLQKYGLLRWHQVAERATRWSLLTWPHTTAVIEERAGLAPWAVDSWFLDNGEPPFVLPLRTWRDGWRPPQQDTAGSGDARAAAAR